MYGLVGGANIHFSYATAKAPAVSAPSANGSIATTNSALPQGAGYFDEEEATPSPEKPGVVAGPGPPAGAGYFDEEESSGASQDVSSSQKKPLLHENPCLHLWSLGLEEQFYVSFPLVMAWAYGGERLLEGRSPLEEGRNSFSSTKKLLCLFAASLLYSAYRSFGSSPNTAFYSVSCRFWQLLLGVLLFEVSKSLENGGAKEGNEGREKEPDSLEMVEEPAGGDALEDNLDESSKDEFVKVKPETSGHRRIFISEEADEGHLVRDGERRRTSASHLLRMLLLDLVFLLCMYSSFYCTKTFPFPVPWSFPAVIGAGSFIFAGSMQLVEIFTSRFCGQEVSIKLPLTNQLMS